MEQREYERVYPTDFMLLVFSNMDDKNSTFYLEKFIEGFEDAKMERLVDAELEAVSKVFRRGEVDILDSLRFLEDNGYIDRELEVESNKWFFTMKGQTFEETNDDIVKLEENCSPEYADYAKRIAESLSYRRERVAPVQN